MQQQRSNDQSKNYPNNSHNKNQHSRKKIVQKTPFFYGWIIVIIGAWAVFLSGPGQTYSVSIFIDAYVEEFGWSRSLISTLYSAATMASGIVMIFMGKLIDRVGQRWMSVFAGIMLAVACFFNSLILGPFMLLIGFFLIRLFGQGLMELVPNTLIPQWFVRKRGRAFAFMEVGGFLSSAALPLVNVWLIHQYGWSGAWQVWAVVLLISFVPLAWIFVHNRPEDFGLLPDQKKTFGDQEHTPLEVVSQQSKTDTSFSTIEENSWTLEQAIRSWVFWGVLFCIAVPAMANTGMTFHIVSILGGGGMTRGESAFILSIMALIAFPISFFAGFLLERMPLYKLFAFTFFIEATGVLVLIMADSYNMALLFGILRGVAGGFGTLCIAMIIPQYFGRAHLGSIKGIGFTSTVIASSLGPLPFGIAFDWFGGYTEILLIMLIFFLLATVIAWINRKP
ncbi:MFS transporter [Evansella tamaricis]|uniref:MFS transporter n=1 Tax=Evansella tamaricis TaxID=2069301 RepID=A0ABS6JBU4_9BACI|nr:MFS transporter [Evansella tamaricis]MBU9710664.1 MFS transporter [Evansella tamaricis]